MGCVRIIRGLGISDVWPLRKVGGCNVILECNKAVACIGPGHGAITIGPWYLSSQTPNPPEGFALWPQGSSCMFILDCENQYKVVDIAR
jgi:hypothetical protein